MESYGGMAGSAVLSEPKSVPAMEMVLKSFAERVERLSMTVTHIEQRFSSVVRPEPPQAVSTASGRDEVRSLRAQSSLGGTVENYAHQIDMLTNRLQSLLQRSEI